MADLSNTFVTVEDIRHYVQDRIPEDNELEFDLSFTDEEIERAMVSAARDFNSIPPIGVLKADPQNLWADTNIFFDGTLVHLYTSLIAKLRRNDFDYDAGGVTVNMVQKRIRNLKEAREEHRELFERAAKALKVTKNLRIGRRVG